MGNFLKSGGAKFLADYGGCSQAKNGRGRICFAQAAEKIKSQANPNPKSKCLIRDAIVLRDSLVTVFSQCNISPCTKMSTCHFGDSDTIISPRRISGVFRVEVR